MIKKYYLILFISSFLFLLQASPLKVVKQTENKLVVQFSAQVDELIKKENISFDELVNKIKTNQIIPIDSNLTLPVINELIAMPVDEVTVEIVKSHSQIIPLQSFDKNSQEIIKLISKNRLYNNKFNNNKINIKSIGYNGELKLGSLTFCPFRITRNNLEIYDKLEIAVNFNYSNTKLSKINLDKNYFPIINPKQAKVNKSEINKIKKSGFQPKNSFDGLYGNSFRIYTKESGIYKITYADLMEAEVLPSGIQLNSVKMLNKGLQVPFLIIGEEDGTFDENDYIEFWADEILNDQEVDGGTNLYKHPFTSENVYIFVWGEGNGIRIIEESAAIQEVEPQNYNRSLYFKDKIHWEEDNSFLRMGYFKRDECSYKYDNWFVDAGVSAVGRKSYNIELTYPDSFSFEPIDVKVMLHGQSFNEHHTISHNAMVWINDNMINEVNSSSSFTDENFYLMPSDTGNHIYSSQLKNGLNQLDIQVLAPTSTGDISADRVALNWVEIEYNRQYKAKENYLEFNKPDFIPYPELNLFQFDLKNFTEMDIQIYKKGVSKLTGFQIEAIGPNGQSGYNIHFQDNIINDNVEYIALREEHKRRPVKIEMMRPYDENSTNSNLLSVNNSADYLLITNREFYPLAEDLVPLMESNGQKVALIDVQNIYDQFNYSIKSPIAIKNFLQYVYFNWDQNYKLQYVNLLGDATYDYREDRFKNADIVPTIFYNSEKFGAVPTDFPFSLLVGNDLIPDIAVGRVPVPLNSELIRYIEKVETFLNSEQGDWINKSLFISGNDKNTFEFKNPKYPAFRCQNQRTIDISMQRNYTTYKLNTVKDDSLDYDPNFGGSTDLINYFDEGLSYISFMGHGGGGIWADVDLMNVNDIDLLNNNGKFPFVNSLSCYTGAFENPGHSSLGDAMLLEADKGCIAFYGASGLGWVHNDFMLGLRLPHFLLTDNLPFGHAVNYSKTFYLAASNYYFEDALAGYKTSLRNGMVHQYNLIGDPALKLNLPENSIEIRLVEDVVEVNDTIHFVVKAPIVAGQGYYELANYKSETKIQIPFYYSGDSVIREIIIPEDFPEDEAIFRVFLSDGNNAYSGYNEFTLNAPFLTSLVTVPESPVPGKSFVMKLSVSSIDSVDHITIKHIRSSNSIVYSTSQQDDGMFVSDSIILRTNDVEFYYSVYVHLTNGGVKKYINKLLSFKDTRPDFAIDLSKIKLAPYGNQIDLEFPVYNYGMLSSADSANVKLYIGEENYTMHLTEIDTTVLIVGVDSIRFHHHINDLNTLSGEKIYVDVSSLLDNDKNSYNNSGNIQFSLNAAYIIQNIGLSFDKNSTDTLRLEEWGTISVNGDDITRNGFISFKQQDLSSMVQNLSTIQPVLLKNATSVWGISITPIEFEPDSLIQLTFNYEQSFFNNSNLAESDIKGYKWNSQITQWTGVESFVDTMNNIVFVKASEKGLYTVMHSADTDPPVIEFAVDGRPLETKSLVSSKPNISIFIEDDNGINVERSYVQVILNDNEVPSNAIFIPDSLNNPGYLGIKVYPQLEPGNHVLTVRVQDVNHNISEKTVSLVVTDEFTLHVFGNYPNPFSDQTIISYFIENIETIDDLEVKVYTVAGRLIRTIKNDINTINLPYETTKVGYHELIWDGTDENGNQVANGVYFAMIRAKYQGKIKKEILKVARIR